MTAPHKVSPPWFVVGLTVATAALASWAAQPPTIADTVTMTVDGKDYPLCALEDCSDQAGQVGIWTDPDTGDQWLSLGDRSYRITR